MNYTLVPLLFLIPFLAVSLSVLTYFLYQKYQDRNVIRNVAQYTIFNTDLDKVKKNLKIKSMVHNFIMAIILIEIATNVSWSISMLIIADPNASLTYFLFRISSVRNQTMNTTTKNNAFIRLLNNMSGIILSLVLPVLCLFLIVLRRAFINLSYNLWVGQYSVNILVRAVAMSVMSLFPKTDYIVTLMYSPLALFDICVYISSSRAFYVLLKGRRDEALHHSSPSDYLEKKKIAKFFFFLHTNYYFFVFIVSVIGLHFYFLQYYNRYFVQF